MAKAQIAKLSPFRPGVKSNIFLDRASDFLGSKAPPAIVASLSTILVPYINFQNKSSIGRMVVATELAGEISDIFRELYEFNFQIAKIVPMASIAWSDEVSMKMNNSSCFNYRTIAGSNRLSLHALGRAIDINPCQNPCFVETHDGEVQVHPARAIRRRDAPGSIFEEGIAVSAFVARGWKWGGHWTSPRDFHHFQKDVEKGEIC